MTKLLMHELELDVLPASVHPLSFEVSQTKMLSGTPSTRSLYPHYAPVDNNKSQGALLGLEHENILPSRERRHGEVFGASE